MKTCSRCLDSKAESEFYRGSSLECKDCKREGSRAYYHRNAEKQNARSRVYHLKNRETLIEKAKDYHRNNRESILEKRRQHYQRNRAALLLVAKNYRNEHREERLAYGRKHHTENRARLNAANRAYHQKNRKRRNKISRDYYKTNKPKIVEYYRKRRQEDATFRLKLNLSSRIRVALRQKIKSAATAQLIGCTIPFLKNYLEARFAPRMTWDNYGHWHVDHHIPCAAFDLTNAEDQKRCFHYSNLRPLWGQENQRKNAARPAIHQAELL